MSFLYDVPRYFSNCFKCLRISNITLHLPYLISIFLKIFKKTNSILCLKLFIYLFTIQILDQIMTIFTQYFFFFSKISLIFSHLELYSWFIDLFFYCFYIIKVKELKSSCIKLQLALLLRISHLFLLRNFKTLLKFLNLIVHWIFGLITLHLICLTYWEGVWL